MRERRGRRGRDRVHLQRRGREQGARGGARAMGKPKRAQGAPSLSSLQKKLSQIDVSAENGSTGAVRGGKSHGKASRRTKQKQKRRGLRHANQNVRHGITSLR